MNFLNNFEIPLWSRHEKTSLKIFKHYKLKPSFSIIKDEKAKGRVGVGDKPHKVIKFDPILISLIQFDPIWSNLIQFIPIWPYLIKFDPIYSTVFQFDHVWSNLIQFDLILSNFILF